MVYIQLQKELRRRWTMREMTFDGFCTKLELGWGFGKRFSSERVEALGQKLRQERSELHFLLETLGEPRILVSFDSRHEAGKRVYFWVIQSVSIEGGPAKLLGNLPYFKLIPEPEKGGFTIEYRP
jgi:hypothetical protein